MRLKDMPKLPLLMIAAMFALGLWAYPHLPARIPMHWGPSGQIDRWADKSFMSVFSEPLMAIALYVLFFAMPYFDPKRANILKSKQVYSLILNMVTALFLLMMAVTLAASFNHSLSVDKITMVATGLLFIVMGNYLGRVKRNWTMGVRTSWTLSDDTVWVKTNRLGGRLFVACGLLAVAGAWLPAPWGIATLLVPALAILPVTYFYSMRLYKRLHPEEVTPPEPER